MYETNNDPNATHPAQAERLIEAIRNQIEHELSRYDTRLRYRHKASRRGGYRPEWLPSAA